MTTTVVWFRRDLRVHDHPALRRAEEAGDALAPLFVVDDRLLTGSRRSPNRAWFMAGSVAALAAELAERGAPLMILRGDPRELVPRFATTLGARRVVVSRDYAPYGRARDDAVRRGLEAGGIAFEAGRGLLVHEPEGVRTAAGGGFSVFGPFSRAWAALDRRPVVEAPARLAAADVGAVTSAFEPLTIEAAFGDPAPTADRALLLEPGERAARTRLDRWAGSDRLDAYVGDRDRLDRDGTSRLSQDLRWGLLSPVEVAERCAGESAGRRRYVAEIAWRDFYVHLLFREPRVARESFRTEFDALPWDSDPARIEAWKEGRTGYPVVDAAMRQLRATGWIHNRARMIAASFLTKHLLADWRVGEAHFMEHLVDGDPASNNGGWQWAASTGTDPQPYFRIFNPTLQGERHDPDGDYVRRWVPELAGVARDRIHRPDPSRSATSGYPPPVVDHGEARARALAAYRGAARRPERD